MPIKKFAVIPILVLGCLACSRSMKTPPQELLGFWTTEAPAYKERYIKFESEYVLFGVGEDQTPAIQRISKIESKRDKERTVYTLYSNDSDGPHQLVLSYDPSHGGSFRIKNQKDVVWKKFGPS